ncbi:MAG: putative fluoride ion transporter CrcB [marine bacterium B5-7]|nr:MAG: putative fluoride ion transporter CrcB [marine bacterium B5-7]
MVANSVLILSIAAGGAVGAVLRFLSVELALHLFGRSLPFGTLLVNIVGSFLIGLLFIWFQSRGPHHEILRAALIIGVLGGFTTFSAFSLETINLALNDQLVRAALNVLLNVVLCIAAAAIGIKLSKYFLA